MFRGAMQKCQLGTIVMLKLFANCRLCNYCNWIYSSSICRSHLSRVLYVIIAIGCIHYQRRFVEVFC